jgi:RNA polymerase sigma-70 factor (ECF subfamily)
MMDSPASTMLDTDLVANVREGDSKAEAALYEKYSARIYFLALSELHSKEDAEDVRAETFLRVIQALRQDKLRSATSLPSFIVGIALNVIREHSRTKYKTDQLDGTETNIAAEHSLELAFLDTETSEAIKEAAAKLKPRERDFLRLYYYEELPKEEIARVLGIKEERLRLIKSRTLKSFRKIYERLKKH